MQEAQDRHPYVEHGWTGDSGWCTQLPVQPLHGQGPFTAACTGVSDAQLVGSGTT